MYETETPDEQETFSTPDNARAADEPSLDELQRELEVRAGRVNELEQTVATLERRSRIDDLLREADALDLEAARILTETAISAAEQPDIEAAVADLKRRKPFLFRQPRSSAVRNVSVLSARIEERDTASDEAVQAAADASASGSRTDLLRYLRLRRKK